MIVKFPLVLFSTCLLPLQLLLQGSFPQEEVKQPHCRDTQRPNIMTYVVPPKAPDHLPLANLPRLPEQCNQSGKNFSKSPACPNTYWWSMEPAVPQKYYKINTWPSWWYVEGSALPSAQSLSRRGSALRCTWRGVGICWHLDLQLSRAGLWGNCCWMGSVLWGQSTNGRVNSPLFSMLQGFQVFAIA